MENNALTTIFLLRALGGGRREMPVLRSRYPGRRRGRRGLGAILPLLLLSGQGGTSNAMLPFLLAENLEEEEEEEEEERGPEHGGGGEPDYGCGQAGGR